MYKAQISLFLGLFLVSFSPKALGAFAAPSQSSPPDRTQTLTYALASFPKTLNPTLVSTADEVSIVGDMTVFDYLVATDPDNGDAVCWLCQEFTYDPKDRKIIKMKLREGVIFHDGKPLSAEDVRFSIEAALHPKVDNMNIKSSLAATIDKVEVLSPLEIKITFKKERFNNIYNLGTVPILPKHLFPYFDKTPEQFNKDTKFGRSPIGSGPYRFSKWDNSKFVELERNDTWWGFKDQQFQNLFNFKKIRFKFITNDNVMLQSFKKGDFDYFILQSFHYDTLRKGPESEKYTVSHLKPKISSGFMWIVLNTRQGRFSDPKTRQALGLLTDRKSTLEKFSKGLRPMTNGPWGIDSPLQCPPEKCPVQTYDPELAKKLLKEAGWADTDSDGCLDRLVNGEKQVLNFTILASEGDYSRNVLGVYTSTMKKAGVCAQAKLLDWSASTKLIDELNFDAQLSGFQSGYPVDPRGMFHSEGAKATGSNHAGVRDPEIDQLVETFETTFDPKERDKIGQKIHERLYNLYPAIWHHETGGCFVGYRKELKGIEVAPFSGSCVFWPRWYKVKT